jgi:two-component system, NtrC family, sensor kinase
MKEECDMRCPELPSNLAELGLDAERAPDLEGWQRFLDRVRSLDQECDRKRKELEAITRDIQEHKEVEVEVRHIQKLEAMGRLAAGIAHEINTPIQFIGDNLSFLKATFDDMLALNARYRALIEGTNDAETIRLGREAFEEMDAEYATREAPGAIKNALDGVARVAEIVRAMKSLAHQDRGERTMANINGSVASALTVAKNEYKYVADLETELGDIPSVPCYLSDLNQVILNLVINAAHAVADKVAGTCERGLIKVRTALEDDLVVISVSDSGTGIPANVRPRIFEPFFTTKEVGRGTGQGLALARAVIVDKHKGTLTFDSEVGKGTTFHVRLPIVAPAVEAARVR